MKRRGYITAAALAFLVAGSANADQEITLFDGNGRATAYIAVDEELTIYLWDGKPVAYLEPSGAGEFDVYGFNGGHLGWFLQGAVWTHDGSASCATENLMQYTQYEPYKSYKQYKPYRSYQEYAPYMPGLTSSFGRLPCGLLLASGAG